MFLYYTNLNMNVIGTGVEFEKSGKIVIENIDNSLTIYNCMDDFLLSNPQYFIKRI